MLLINPYWYKPSDPFLSSNVLLLTAQSGNVDSSPIARTLTPFGTPIINSTIPLNTKPTYFQDGTWRYDIDGTYLPGQLGSGEWCWEMWMYFTQYSVGAFVEVHNVGGLSFSIQPTTGLLNIGAGLIGGNNYNGNLGNIPLNEWHHIALIRDNRGGSNDVLHGTLDGVQIGIDMIMAKGPSFTGTGIGRVMGYHASASAAKFVCAGMRLTKGTRRYLSIPFTADVTPFPSS